MLTGPNGEKRPADVIANAVHSMRIATGEATEEHVSNTRKGGLKGGRTRAETLSPERRRAIAHKASAARWSRKEDGCLT